MKSNIYAKYVYDGGHVCVGCGKGHSINRRSLDDDRDEERVNSGLIGVVAIPGISNTLEPARVGQGNPGRQTH